MRPVLLLGLLLLGSVGGCSFNEDGVSAGALDGKVTPPDDARDEQGRLIDGRVDGPADGGGGGDADADGQPPAADSTADTVAPDSTVDTVAPDSTVDTVAPDSSVDSGPPVYIDESFTNGAGSLSSNRGSWSYQGGSATQSSLTKRPPRDARAATASTKRVFPTPGSPSTKRSAPLAARASTRA